MNKTQHVIGYAFPTSSLAKKLGFSRTGCYTVEVAGTVSPVKTFSEAKTCVEKLGTEPGRWSWDHPLNSHFTSLSTDTAAPARAALVA